MLFNSKNRLEKLTAEAGRYADRYFEPERIQPVSLPKKEPSEKPSHTEDIRFSLDFSVDTKTDQTQKERVSDLLDRYFETLRHDDDPDMNILEKFMEDSFSDRLKDFIQKSGRKEAQVYRDANIDRKLFSKIKTDRNFHPSKDTVMAFCFALGLDRTEAQDLLKSAGYTLSRSIRRDVIMEFFLVTGDRKITEINAVLSSLQEKPLGREK